MRLENEPVFHNMRNVDSSVRKRAQSEVEANALAAAEDRHPETGALPGAPGARFALTADQQRHLREALLHLEVGSYHARRLQVVLLTSQGLAAREVALRLGLSRFHVSRIRSRFRAGGVEALVARGRSGRPSSVSLRTVTQVLDMAALPPPPGTRRWSLRMLARAHGLSHSSVYRILRAHGVAPYAGGRSGRAGPADPV